MINSTLITNLYTIPHLLISGYGSRSKDRSSSLPRMQCQDWGRSSRGIWARNSSCPAKQEGRSEEEQVYGTLSRWSGQQWGGKTNGVVLMTWVEKRVAFGGQHYLFFSFLFLHSLLFWTSLIFLKRRQRASRISYPALTMFASFLNPPFLSSILPQELYAPRCSVQAIPPTALFISSSSSSSFSLSSLIILLSFSSRLCPLPSSSPFLSSPTRRLSIILTVQLPMIYFSLTSRSFGTRIEIQIQRTNNNKYRMGSLSTWVG